MTIFFTPNSEIIDKMFQRVKYFYMINFISQTDKNLLNMSSLTLILYNRSGCCLNQHIGNKGYKGNDKSALSKRLIN